MTPCVRRFDKCVACGNTVAEEYASRGAEFVKEVVAQLLTYQQTSGLGVHEFWLEYSPRTR